MLKNVRKSRILLSIAIIALIFILLGNVYSLATEGGNTVTITATTDNTANTGNTNTNTNTNAVSNVTPIVSSTDNTANNATNNVSSTYNATNTTTNTSTLPHTGTDSKSILLVVVFAVSAVYAYKKVNDYNF